MAELEWNGSCSEQDSLSRNSTSDLWRLSQANHTVYFVILCLLIIYVITGFIWNMFIVLSLIKFKLFKKPTYMILLNLVMVDLLQCLLVVLIDLVSEGYMEFVFGNSDYARCYFCKFHVIVIYALNNVSLDSLTLMSLDRLIYIKWPLKYKHVVTMRNIFALLATIWALSVLPSLPLLFDYGELHVYKFVYCKLDLPNSIPYYVSTSILNLPMGTVIILSNLWILKIVYKSRREKLDRQLQNSANTDSDKVKQQKKKYYKDQLVVSRVFGGIVGISVTLWIVVTGLSIAATQLNGQSLQNLVIILHLVYYIKLVVHPLIETCLIPQGRHIVWKAFCCTHREPLLKQ